jgi:hypothetical protein
MRNEGQAISRKVFARHRRERGQGNSVRSGILAMLIAAVIAMPSVADCRLTVAPTFVRELAPDQYTSARSIAWRDDHRVLIGTRGHGIVEYDTNTASAKPIVGGSDIPAGMPDVEKLDTDGTTIVAFNRDRTDVAFDLRKGKLVHTRRAAVMRIMDMAVRDGKVAVLGYSFKPADGGSSPVWLGDVGASWEEHELLYDAGPKFDDYFRFALAPHAGAVRFIDKDTVAFVLPSEAGVFRYRTDGTALPRLGRDMTELITPDVPLIAKKYNTDVAARYQEVVNRTPTIDDLVILAGDGPAVVVRRWSKGKVSWELWIASERATRKLRLGIEDSRVAGGHLRCDAFLSKVACLFGKQTQPGQPDKPYLALFDVSKTVKQCD